MDSKGRENIREKRTLVVHIVRHLVTFSTIGTPPSKCGNTPNISRHFLKLVALRVNMDQVGVHGEILTNQIKDILTTAMLDTPHQGKFTDNHAWQEVHRLHANILAPTGIVQSQDTRCQWVAYKKMQQWYQDHKVTYSIGNHGLQTQLLKATS